MDTVTIIAGQTITVGIVASCVAQIVKTKMLGPYFHHTLILRSLVAVSCVALNAFSLYLSGASLDLNALLTGFGSYLVAAGTYDNLFKE